MLDNQKNQNMVMGFYRVDCSSPVHFSLFGSFVRSFACCAAWAAKRGFASHLSAAPLDQLTGHNVTCTDAQGRTSQEMAEGEEGRLT